MNKVNTKNSEGFSGRNQKFKRFFRPKTSDLPKKSLHPKNVVKSGVSPQKLQKYRWQTPIWASICTPVAPSLLISSEHSPRLGGHKQSFGRARPRNAPLWRRVCSACFHSSLVTSLFQFSRTYKTFVTFCPCSYTACIGEFYRTWSDFFSIEVEQIMWSSRESI